MAVTGAVLAGAYPGACALTASLRKNPTLRDTRGGGVAEPVRSLFTVPVSLQVATTPTPQIVILLCTLPSPPPTALMECPVRR